MPQPKSTAVKTSTHFFRQLKEAWGVLVIVATLVAFGVSWTSYLQAQISDKIATERTISDVRVERLEESTYPATKGIILEHQVAIQVKGVEKIYNKLEEIDARQRKMQSTLDVLSDRASR